MTKTRKLIMLLGLLLLAISLSVIVLASLPGERVSDSQTIPQPDLTLPTPVSAISHQPRVWVDAGLGWGA